MLSAAYLWTIQYLIKTRGTVLVKLISNESYENAEYKANCLICKALDNLVENSLSYLKHRYKKFGALKSKQKGKTRSSTGLAQFKSRVETEFLKLSYSASIGDEFEDGSFNKLKLLMDQFIGGDASRSSHLKWISNKVK